MNSGNLTRSDGFATIHRQLNCIQPIEPFLLHLSASSSCLHMESSIVHLWSTWSAWSDLSAHNWPCHGNRAQHTSGRPPNTSGLMTSQGTRNSPCRSCHPRYRALRRLPSTQRISEAPGSLPGRSTPIPWGFPACHIRVQLGWVVSGALRVVRPWLRPGSIGGAT